MDSAGCGALMKEYGSYLEHDSKYVEKAKLLSSKVKDLSEFLFEIGLRKPEKEFLHKITYHDACHLVHAQKISAQPRTLLQSIPGIKYYELNEASWCCGSAGIYNVVRYDDSMQFLDRKMKNVTATNAEYVVANNPGCLGQIEYGAKNRNLSIKAVHLATLLAEVYEL